MIEVITNVLRYDEVCTHEWDIEILQLTVQHYCYFAVFKLIYNIFYKNPIITSNNKEIFLSYKDILQDI